MYPAITLEMMVQWDTGLDLTPVQIKAPAYLRMFRPLLLIKDW